MSLWNVFIGGLTEDVWSYFPRPEPDTTIPAEGIERFIFNDVTGVLRRADSVTDDLFSPQYLVLHPRLPVLYAAEFAQPGRLVSFTIARDGRLERQSTIETMGALAIAVDIDPTGSSAYVAHLGDGGLTKCTIGVDGSLLDADRVTQDPSRVGTRLHQVRFTPHGDHIVVTDFGRDEVITYALDVDQTPSPVPVSIIKLPSGSAPRHIEFHPSAEVVYILCEADPNMYALKAPRHVPVEIMGSYRVVSQDIQGRPSEFQLHPDGRTLFVGVRRADTIAALTLNQLGVASNLYHEPSRGISPRGLRLDPVGKHLLVANWHSNSIVVFAIDHDRRLSVVGEPLRVNSPSSIVFAPPRN